jgi:hypothetical protein
MLFVSRQPVVVVVVVDAASVDMVVGRLLYHGCVLHFELLLLS